MTNNHGYNTPSEGTTDWHVPLNKNFRQLDSDVEIRDVETNLSEYDPTSGAKYFSTDTGAIYLGNGDTWSQIGAVKDSSHPSGDKVWVARTPDEMAEILDNKLPNTGGIVSLIAGQHNDETWTKQISIPNDEKSITLDLTGARMHIDTWGPGPDTPLIKRDFNREGKGPRKCNIIGGYIYAWNAPSSELGTAIELFDTRRSRITPRIAGQFDVGLSIRRNNGSGHMDYINPLVTKTDIGIKIGDDRDPLGVDRSFIYGQMGSIRETGVRIEQGSWNHIYAQPMENAEGNPPWRGIEIPYNMNNGDNTIYLSHRVDSNKEEIYPLDIQHPRTRLNLVGLGANEAITKCRLSIPPSQIESPSYKSRLFEAGFEDFTKLLQTGAPTGGVVEPNQHGAIDINAGRKDGGTAYVRTPGRPGIPTLANTLWARFGHISTSDAVHRLGWHVDKSNYLMLLGDSNVGTWKIEAVRNGTRIESIDTGKEMNSGLQDFTVFAGADEGLSPQQIWYKDYEEVAETNVDISSLGKPERMRIDVTVKGSPGTDRTLGLKALDMGKLRPNR